MARFEAILGAYTTLMFAYSFIRLARVSGLSLRTFSEAPAKFVPFPFTYRQEIELSIETLTNRGWGIGRIQLQGSDGSPPWVIMVPNVIPGERVRVRVFRNYKNYSEADLLEILEVSPHRVTPQCTLAETCGGCQYQHATSELQREWKRKQVEEAYQHHGLSVPVEPCLGTEHIYGYRSKITPHFQAPGKQKRGQRPNPTISAIGFQKQTSRQIIDVPECPIATKEVNLAYQRVRDELLSQPTNRTKGMTLFFRQGNLKQEAVTNPKEFLTTHVNGLQFTYRANNFFQNNYYVLPLMVDAVVQEASRPLRLSDGSSRSPTHLVDCYCGSGLFAISAASRFQTAVGIEINDLAVAEAKANTKANGVDCDFIAATAEGIFNSISYPRESTVVVLDPPRKGCSPAFLQQLFRFQPARIVYLSCDPATQARDAALMVIAGYKIQSVLPIDLFPQTRHIECLTVFEKGI